MKVLDQSLLRVLATQADQSPRRRANHNLHPQLDDPVQRLFNVLEPDSYIRPHRHADPLRWELFLVLRGACVVLTFGDDGRVRERSDLSAAGPLFGVELEPGVWHALAAFEPGTAIFEIKQGPYVKPPPEAFAVWAPPEGDPRCPAFVEWYRSARPGDLPPAI